MNPPPFLLAALAATSTDPGRTCPEQDLGASIRPLVERAMARGLLPGLQLAVVERDGTIWTTCAGVADVGSGRPVTEDTRFYVASTSKALMGLTAALLDHRGEIALDTPLDEAFPVGTRFHPDYDPSTATVLDLLTHTHGMTQPPPMTFRVSITGQYTNEDLFALLPTAAPAPDRSFRYSNLGYNLYGLLVAPEETRGWKPVQRALVLDPLGMDHTTNRPSTLDPSVIAMPHEVGPKGFERVPTIKGDRNIGPAGGAFSTAGDLARLALVELGLGRIDGEQVFPREVIEETQRIQVPQDRSIFYYHRHGWGIGWDVGTYDDELVLHRPGAFAGYYANVAFLPERGFGIAVLGNGGQYAGHVCETIVGAVYDVLCGREDAVRLMDQRLDAIEAHVREEREAAARRVAELELLDEPLRPLAAYVGTYGNPALGSFEVVRGDGGLRLLWGELRRELTPQPRGDADFDPFHARIADDDDQLRFHLDEGGAAERVTMRGIPLSFERR